MYSQYGMERAGWISYCTEGCFGDLSSLGRQGEGDTELWNNVHLQVTLELKGEANMVRHDPGVVVPVVALS